MGDDTTIRIKVDTWEELHDRKQPGLSFDDVIQRLLDEAETDEPQTTRITD